MKYRDVTIHTNSGIFGKEDETKKFPPIQQRIDLSNNIWVGRLDLQMAKTIMDTPESFTRHSYEKRGQGKRK